MTSAIITTFRTGRQSRICARCMLFCDREGNPDPTYYNAAARAKLAAIPAADRCTHMREEKPTS